MSSRSLASAVTVARALGHPARLRAVAMLSSGELCVCQITEVLKLATSTVSLHLRELKRCGLVTERKEGRWVYVGLSDEPLAREWVRTALAAVSPDPQVEEDARRVEELRELPVEDLCRLGLEGARARACSSATKRTGGPARPGRT
jgi:DNA-binding transcriptional ArsR family regulator